MRVFFLAVCSVALASAQPAINVSQVTHNGKSGDGAALSRDGKWLAYVRDDGDAKHSLWLHEVAVGQDRKIADKLWLERPVFSPDAKSIWALVQMRPGFYNLNHWSVADGVAKVAAQDVDTAITFSPDGKTVAFIRWAQDAPSRLLLLPAAGGNARELLTFKRRPGAVAWSPDGKEIAVPVREDDLSRIRFISVAKGTTREIRTPGVVDALVWTGMALFATMHKADGPGPSQVWMCAMPAGAWKQVTNDDGGYQRRVLSASADGSLLAAARLVKFQTGLEDLAAWFGNKDGGPRTNPDVVLIRPGKN